MPHSYTSSIDSSDREFYKADSFFTTTTTTSTSNSSHHASSSPAVQKSKVLLEECKDRLSKCFQRPCCPCAKCAAKKHLFGTGKRA